MHLQHGVGALPHLQLKLDPLQPATVTNLAQPATRMVHPQLHYERGDLSLSSGSGVRMRTCPSYFL